MDDLQPKETSLAKYQQPDASVSSNRLNLWKRLTGAVDGFVDGFFTPGVPLPPVAPEGSPPRQFDYPLTWNIDIAPRSGMALTFEQLWGLADNWDLLRMIIERRKEEMSKLSWGLSYKDLDEELSDADLAIQRQLEMPDGEHDFPTWIKAVLEDYFVGDCVSIEPVLRPDGSVYGVFGVDGATINVKIDERGRTPLPPNTAYQQIIKGVVYANFTKQELIYHPGNLRFSRVFGVSKVEQIYILANIALRRQMQQLYAFTEGTLPDALMTGAEGWSPQQLREFQDYFDSRYSGNLKKRSKLTWIPKGSAAINLKGDPLKQEFDEWMARMACFVFSISPQGFVKEMNRATASTAKDQARQEGLEPVMAYIAGLMNRILREVFKRPDLIFVWTDESQTDPKEEQEMDVAYIEHAVYSVDEVRQRKGLDKIGMDHAVWTTQGPVFVKDLVANGGAQLQPPPTGEPAPDTGKAVKALTNAPNGHLPRLPMPNKAALKKKYEAALEGVFAKGREKLIDEVFALMGTRPSTKASKPEDDEDEADEISKQADLNFLKPVQKEMEPLYVEGAQASAAQALRQAAGRAEIKTPDIRDLLKQADSKAIDWGRDRAAQLVGKKLVNGEIVDNPNAKWQIEDSTRDMLREKVQQGLQEGWSREHLANEIESDVIGPQRARAIAQTELGFTHSQGSRIGWRASGVVRRRYSQLSADHIGYDVCDENAEAGEIPIDELYPSGDDGYPFHPNCECAEIAVVEGSDGEDSEGAE